MFCLANINLTIQLVTLMLMMLLESQTPATFLRQCPRGMMLLLPLLHSPLFATLDPDFSSCANVMIAQLTRILKLLLSLLFSNKTFTLTFTIGFYTLRAHLATYSLAVLSLLVLFNRMTRMFNFYFHSYFHSYHCFFTLNS